MSAKAAFSPKKVHGIPIGMPFVQLTLELLNSPAWRARSINCIRLIDFLLIRHMQHGGSENGQLVATYDELVEHGIARRLVHKTIQEAESLNLIRVERGGRKGYAQNYCSKFRLTFLVERLIDAKKIVYFGTPTNEWRKITPGQAAAIANKKPEKFKIEGYESEP